MNSILIGRTMRIALWLHFLAVVIWVGGMFFAHVALRPAVQSLAPGVRLPLMAAVLGRFFNWVSAAIGVLLVTGFFMILAYGGFAAISVHVHVMTALGLVMAAIFAYIVWVPMPKLRASIADEAWEAAGASMTLIRRLVSTNLVLGLVTLTVAMLGHGAI